MKFSEKWLREWVHPQLNTEELAHQLTMAGLEVDNVQTLAEDSLIEIDLTPNRGDCLSIAGLAREIGTLNRIHLTPVKVEPVAIGSQHQINIVIKDPEYCPHYVGRSIQGIQKNVTTPLWMQEKLTASDIRCVHPVVDVLNYVMLELGQPMHAFDEDKIQGAIIVRCAQNSEKIILLDDKEVQLKEDILVIADQKRALAIAGIMGGKESAVNDKTQNIFLESALFMPIPMAGKARALSLHTDSSYRFERGVDPDLQTLAMERATQLICEICGGKPGPVVEVTEVQYLPKKEKIYLREKQIGQVLGMKVSREAVVDILQHLGCKVTESFNHSWTILPPPFRYDLTEEIDLIEEIVRILGYDVIGASLPLSRCQFILQPENEVSVSRLKRALVDFGYQEAITYSFVDENVQKQLFPAENALPLKNPISAEMGVMRISLWPGLLMALKYNQNRQQMRLKLFEIGLCFKIEGGVLNQEKMLGGLFFGNATQEHWDIKKRSNDFFDMKQVIESLWHLLGFHEQLEFRSGKNSACQPGQCAEIFWREKSYGFLGKLHPQLEKQLSLDGPVYLFEIKLELFLKKPLPSFQRPSRFPEIRRDISMRVDKPLQSDKLIRFITDSVGDVLREVKIFDVYSGKGIEPGRKSIALGLILQHSSRTLVDDEVDEIVKKVVAGLNNEFGAELRD